MSEIDPKKMKVAELREELKARGLDTKGVKQQLVARLLDALAEEAGDEPEEMGEQTLDEINTTTEDYADDSPVEAEAPLAQPESDPESEPEADADSEPEIVEAPKQAEPEPSPSPEMEPSPEPSPAPEAEKEQEEEMPAAEEPVPVHVGDSPIPVAEEAMEEEPMVAAEEQAPEAPVLKEPETTQETTETVEENGEKAMEQEANKDLKESPVEAQVSEGEKEAAEVSPVEESRPITTLEGGVEAEKPAEGNEEKKEQGQKRHHTPEKSHYRHRSRSPQPRNVAPMESDDWLSATTVQLDRYNCDLNIRINDNGLRANPITVEGFAYMWAGARAMWGIAKGKVCFEVKLLEDLNVSHLPPEETSRHVVRVGWSADNTSLQLGEEKNSWGYGGTGKASVDCKFEDYGQKFGEGDVIGAYVDFESNPVEISYTKNGEDLGKAFDVDPASLDGMALFPHVLSKNCEFEINFGDREEPFFAVKEGFTLIGKVAEEDRVRGTLPPVKKEDCEIIMMCGLPGAGKTYWAAKHAQENVDKKFNVLGTNNIIDKMKVMGLPRKRNYEGRWDLLIDKATKCLNRVLEIASKKKRNYILDQTNVYPSAQRRKMRPFEGFQQKAVVIVPSDDEFKKRVEKREKEEGKDVPDSAVLEMKANFQLPDESQTCEFVELPREEAQKLVEQYNKEGRDALPPPDKRFRGGRDHYGGGRDMRGRDFRGGGSYRGGYDRDRGGRGGYGGYNRGGRGGYNYNDRRGGGYQGYNRDNKDYRSGGSGGSTRPYQGGWKGQGQWGDQRGWGNQGGNWGNQGSSWGNQGSWGNNQGYGNQGWGQYQGNQNWGQNYNYNQGSWGSWPGYNQGQQTQQPAAQQPAAQQPAAQQQTWGNYNYNQYGQGAGTQPPK